MDTNETTALQPMPTLNPLALRGETAVASAAAQAMAEVQARRHFALAVPRDLSVVTQKFLKECERPTLARAAIYRKPIGKGIEGPSIRLAEVAARCMTNLMSEAVAIFDDKEKRIVRVTVTDLESNTTYAQDVTIEKTVERSSSTGYVVRSQRINSFGKTTYIVEATDDDLLNKQGSLVSKALRNLIFRHFPGDILDEGMAKARRIRADAAAKDPDSEKRAILDAFFEIGVSAEQVMAFIGPLESLSPKDLATLRSVYTAVHEGTMSWSEVVDSRDKAKDAKGKPTTLAEATAQAKPLSGEK